MGLRPFRSRSSLRGSAALRGSSAHGSGAQ
jgi:hypothetical protein